MNDAHRRPVFSGNGVQARDDGVAVQVQQDAEAAGNFQGTPHFPAHRIGNPADPKRRRGFCFELRLECRQLRRLIVRDRLR